MNKKLACWIIAAFAALWQIAPVITASQCRAARALLRWSQRQLADAAQVSPTTIQIFESRETSPHRSTLASLRRALEEAGIKFINKAEERDDSEVGVVLKQKSDSGTAAR